MYVLHSSPRLQPRGTNPRGSLDYTREGKALLASRRLAFPYPLSSFVQFNTEGAGYPSV